MADINDYDDLDRRIIELLCTSSEGSFRQIAKQLNIHPTTLIQRVKSLESKDVITGYRAKVNYMNLGLEYMGFIQVYTEGVVSIQDMFGDIPQVMAVFEVTGNMDCVLLVSCLSRDEFSETIRKINSIDGVKKTNTSVVLKVVKDENDFVPVLRDRELPV